MNRFFNNLKTFVDHPATHLLVGLALIITGATEIYGDFLDESRRFRVGAHHGIVILGVIQALSALPDVVQGLEQWFHAAEIHREREHDQEHKL